MRSSVWIGRLGPLVMGLNYTWIFITILGLWGLALLWMPDNAPGFSGALYWLIAAAIMVLYLVNIILREVLRAVVAGFDKRAIILYPFGAATPYRLDEIGTWRILASMLAGPAFHLALGGSMLLVADRITGADDLPGVLHAVLVPLGTMNIAVALLNLIPGIPFDMGRALTSILYWFSGERERGLNFTRVVGELASLGMVLAGAWIGLTSQQWIIALTLVVIGWGAREAEEKGKQFNVLRVAMSEIKAQDIMADVRPADAVYEDDTVAEVVHSHRYYAADTPLPVMKEADLDGGGAQMLGVVTLAQADTLLQGDWPSTPVTALMTRTDELTAVEPDERLSRIVEMIGEAEGSPDEQQAIPVVGQGMLLGSIDPTKLRAFENAGMELGAAEAPYRDAEHEGFMSRLGGLLPGIVVIAVMAIIGNMAFTADPSSMRPVRTNLAGATFSFSETVPTADAVISPGALTLSVVAVSANPITTATLSLDGTPLQLTMSGPLPVRQTITAQAPELTEGLHTASLVVADRAGALGRTDWQFRVGTNVTPTPAPGVETLQISGQQPAHGARVKAGSDVGLRAVVTWLQQVVSARIFLDGTERPAIVEEGTENHYTITASAAGVPLGLHIVRLEVQGESDGMYVAEWTFSAIEPDDSNMYFPETGFFMSADFFKYWQEHGGVDIFGYPISDRLQETDDTTGEVYTAQYFERARFEQHPSTGDQVILGRLAALVHEPEPPVLPVDGARFFPETGHNVSGVFLNFWEERGGLPVFGYPTSEEFAEVNFLDGKEYTVQYFERFKLELHPELAGTAYEVQLGQLGTEIYSKKQP
jgi:Zn-dependent protease